MVPPSNRQTLAAARIGKTLGKYRLDSLLGSGGMADVYAATHRNKKRVAIKVLDPELSASSSIRTHFQREGYAANSVGHPGAVVIDDDDVAEDGTFFIVMELLKGIGVDELRRKHHGRLPVSWAVSIVDQLLDVLSEAHSNGIFHRDIKPPNLFLIGDGSLKVLDFGIARFRDAAAIFGSNNVTGTGDSLGTPGFMAPEQALGRAGEIDARTDLWAASATLFTLVSGELVHIGSTPQELRVCSARDEARRLAMVVPSIPAAIADVVDRGLALDQRSRWSTAPEMRNALSDAYASSFGEAPERVTESKWEPPIPVLVDCALAPTSVIVPASSGRSDLVAKTITERPVASGAPQKRRSRMWPAALISATLLALTATGVLRLLSRSQAVLVPVLAPSVVSDPPTALQPNETHAAGRPPSAAPPGVPEVGPQETVSPAGPDGEAPTRPPSAHGPPRGSADKQRIDRCNPPTTTDMGGIKHPKPWCL